MVLLGAGTIAANASLSTRELQAWMGHADARTTAQRTLSSSLAGPLRVAAD